MKTLAFYGVCDCRFKLDDTVWMAVEDLQDGYRSMMEKIERVTKVDNLTFSSAPFAQVQVRKNDDLEGYELVDDTGHVWLTMGTDACFVFRYTPPLPSPSFEEFIK